MKLIWSRWNSLKKKIRSKQKKFLILDFDGTLVAIASAPEKVSLGTKTKNVLKRLGLKKNYQLAVISGRRLKDLVSYLRLKNVLYVGNHGFEISSSKFSQPIHPGKLRAFSDGVLRTHRALKRDFKKWKGVLVENKAFTLSVHYRNLAPARRPLFQRKMDLFVKSRAGRLFHWRRGKMTWEMRPAIAWDKGAAALFLLKKFRGHFPIVVGDDQTDEDMFRALKKKGLTVRVGSRKSKAQYYLRSQREVVRFLEELCAL